MPLNKSSNQPTFIQSNLSSLLVGCFLVAGLLVLGDNSGDWCKMMDKEDTSSSSGNWRQYLNISSDKEGDSAPEPSTARAPNQVPPIDPSSGTHTSTGATPTASDNPGPSEIPAQAGPGAIPDIQSIKERLENFIGSFTKIKPRADFLMNVKEKLGLYQASPEKLQYIDHTIELLASSPNEECQFQSGKEASKALLKAVKDWEKAREES